MRRTYTHLVDRTVGIWCLVHAIEIGEVWMCESGRMVGLVAHV